MSTRDKWIRRLAAYCWRFKASLLASSGGALAAAALLLVVPLFERAAVDGLTRPGHPITPWLICLGIAAPLGFAFAALRVYYGGRFSLGVQYELRTEMHRKLLRTDGGEHDGAVIGQSFSRATSDLALVQILLSFVPRIAGSILLLAGTLVASFLLSPLLSAVVVLVMAVFLVGSGFARRKMYPATWDAQQTAGELAGVVDEYVAAVRVVKGLGQDGRMAQAFDRVARMLFAKQMRTVRMSSRISPALWALPSLGQVVVLAAGGWLAVRGSVSLGTLLAFITYLGQIYAPVSMLSSLAVSGPRARAAMHRIFDIIDLQPDVVESPVASPVSEPAAGMAEVEFVDVGFAYDSTRPVLQGFSLRVATGETVALVGRVGSGKSTAALLMVRLFDVQSGSVRVRGRDIRELTLDSLRATIGFVPEETMLFSESVRANIAFGRPGATGAEIIAAAAAAGVHDFASALPDGYDTVVGDGGLTLSGGQRQRIAIARAIIKSPPLLLLDDATSAVDASTEAEIHDALARASEDRTTILICHRRSTLRLADRIAVVDDGRVVDTGSHEELLGRCGLYRLLVSGPGADAEGIGAGELSSAADDQVSPWSRPAMDASTAVRGRKAVTADLERRIAALAETSDIPEPGDGGITEIAVPLRLRTMLAPFRWRLVVLICVLVIDALAGISFPLLVQSGIDRGVAHRDTRALLVISGAALAAALGGWLAEACSVREAGRVAERLLYRLRTVMFAHMRRLGLDFHEREGAGRLLTRMTSDLDAVAAFTRTGVAPSVISALTILGVFAGMAAISPVLSTPLLLMTPVLACGTWLFGRSSSRVYSDAREKAAEVNANLHESIRGARLAQAFHREKQRGEAFGRVSEAHRRSQLDAQRLMSFYFPFIQLVFDGSAVAVIALSQGQSQRGTSTAAVVVAFLIYLDMLYSPAQQLAGAFDSYQQARVGLRKIGGLLDAAGPAQKPGRPANDPFGTFEIDDLSFTYPGTDRAALSGITLRIGAGETVALVGASGAGKSSLVKLLARYYEPSAGTIRIDGQEATAYDLDSYRKRLVAVAQEPFLLAGTVRETIAYCRPEMTDEEVEAAATAVGAHAMINSLSGGYLHPVSSGGRNLSAGQRQLLSLSRAFAAAPDVLLLDEATASLDPVSEAAVTEAMAAVTGRQTTVIVAHRLATAARADRIVVLEDGRIVESGTQTELMAVGGSYRRMYDDYDRPDGFNHLDRAGSTYLPTRPTGGHRSG